MRIIYLVNWKVTFTAFTEFIILFLNASSKFSLFWVYKTYQLNKVEKELTTVFYFMTEVPRFWKKKKKMNDSLKAPQQTLKLALIYLFIKKGAKISYWSIIVHGGEGLLII